MTKCYNCDKCKIITDETGYAEARCIARSETGREITWAHTVYNALGRFVANGKDIVMESLKKRIAPSWCSKRKKEKKQKEI